MDPLLASTRSSLILVFLRVLKGYSTLSRGYPCPPWFTLWKVFVWREDVRRHIPWRGTGNPDGYRPAWSKCWRGRAFPAPHAGHRWIAGHERRTNGAACADARGREG